MEIFTDILTDIAEFLLELFVTSNKIPKAIRYIIVSAVHVFLIALFVFLAIGGLRDGSLFITVLFFTLAAALISTFLLLIRKIKKS